MSRLWLVCYDISDDRRRGQVAKVLADRGLRVLESVFEVFLESWEVPALREELARLLDLRSDGVRFYPLCDSCHGAATWQGAGAQSVRGDWFWL